MQPFKSGMVVTKSDFCGRGAEIKRLREYLASKNRCYVHGERRVGKTSLVMETCARAKTKCLVIDLLGVKTEDDVVRRSIKAAISHCHDNESKLLKVMKRFSSLTPNVSIDPLSGLPCVGLAPTPELTMRDLDSAFGALKNIGTVIFFDEFQDILQLQNHQRILSVMRATIQHMNQNAFVFAGSLRNKMLEIFNDPSSPFFKSAFPLMISAIDRDDFRKFIKKKFKSGKRLADDDVINEILDICGDVPGDAQKLCACIWEATDDGDRIKKAIIPVGVRNILSQEIPVYERIVHELSAQQFKVLKAIAKLGGESPVDKKLAETSGIHLLGSITKAAKGLEDKRIILTIEGRKKIANPFLKSWLITKNV